MAVDPSLQAARDAMLRAHEARPDAMLVLIGPTASGKTELAVSVAEALHTPVLGADSVQIVRHFDIGSGKPGPDEIARAPHRLIDCVDPLESVDAAHFARLADREIAALRAKGKPLVVCGGTFLWVRALVNGLVEAPPADEALRAKHRDTVAREGAAALHAELRVVDPPSAERLHPNDVLRVSRALEVFVLSGKRQSDLFEAHGFRTQRHPSLFFGRHCADLDDRIARRARAWLAQGWLDEVRALLARGYGEARAMGSVGYHEAREHLEGRLPEAELLPSIVRSTRVFVRRQRTWLRDAPVTWLPGSA